jgi:hypothetical protein
MAEAGGPMTPTQHTQEATMLTYRTEDATSDSPVMTGWRGAIDPLASPWITDDPYAAAAYGPVHEIRLIGRIASPEQYPVLNGYDPKSSAPELNFDAICNAYNDGYVAIGPFKDINGHDYQHNSWVVVGDLIP